jgi:hypothetical protein
MLGTNDLLHYSEVSAQDAARGISTLVDLLRIACARLGAIPPEVLLVAPAHAFGLSEEMKTFCQGDPAKTMRLGACYWEIATRQGCAFLDAADVVAPSTLDGINLDAAGHGKLGIAVAQAAETIPTHYPPIISFKPSITEASSSGAILPSFDDTRSTERVRIWLIFTQDFFRRVVSKSSNVSGNPAFWG